MSRLVAGLEDALGVTLVERTARRVALTGAGEALLDDAQETLDSVCRIQRRARGLARGRLGAVSVGFIWSTLPAYLAPLVAAAGRRHPDITLSVSQLRFVDILPALRRGDVDLVIGRAHLGDCEMVISTLNLEPAVVAIPEGHPLAAAEVVEQGQLSGEPMLALGRETIPTAFDAVRARFTAAGIRPSSFRGVSSTSEALALVAAGFGIYYRMPVSAIVRWPGVVFREIRGLPMRTLLVCRPEPPPPAIAAIADLAAELFADAPNASNDARGALEGALAVP